MPIYDHTGAVLGTIGKVLDLDGTANRPIGKVFDHTGAVLSAIWEDEIPIYELPLGTKVYLPRKDGGGNDGWNAFMVADHEGDRNVLVAWQPVWPDLLINVTTGVWYEGGEYGGDALSQACLKVHQKLNDAFMTRVYGESHPWVRNTDGTGNYVVRPNPARVWPLSWTNASGDVQGQPVGERRLQYFSNYGWDGFHAGVNERVFTRDQHLNSAGYQIIIDNSGNATQMTGGYCRPCLITNNIPKFTQSGDGFICTSW